MDKKELEKALNVADYIVLKYQKVENNNPLEYGLTITRLQKLFYFCDKEYRRVNKNEKLTELDYCLWGKGPVIPELYDYYCPTELLTPPRLNARPINLSYKARQIIDFIVDELINVPTKVLVEKSLQDFPNFKPLSLEESVTTNNDVIEF